MARTLITNVHILDCSGAEPLPGEVLVEGPRIVRIANSSADVLPRDNVDMVDGQGGYLMPGLVESHAHLSIDNTDDLAALGRIAPEEHTLLTMHNAKLYLDHGITSCISAAAAKPRLDVVIRNEINAGKIPGPRLLAASPWLTVTGGLGDMRTQHMPNVESMALTLDGPDEFRRITRELIREGVDIIKLVVSGDSFVPHAPSESTVMTEAEIAAAAEIVHGHGKRMSAHARSAESVKLCIKHGVKVIYHANFADEEAIDLLEQNKDWVFISPNIGFTVAAAFDGSAWFTEEQVAEMGFHEELVGAARVVKQLHERGVRILAGGDYGFGLTPHGQNAMDIQHFVNHLGFTPMESILAMTKHGAAAMNLGDELGQIREGFLADMMIVNGNPLDNPALLAERANLRWIMKDGDVFRSEI